MFVLITGGSGSGKSAFAESLMTMMKDSEKKIYLATMIPYGKEGKEKIARHRFMRKNKGFETVECFYDLETVFIPHRSSVLLECMSNLVANEMFDPSSSFNQFPHDHTMEMLQDRMIQGVIQMSKKVRHLCVVTNEVFHDGDSYAKETLEYMKVLGNMNQGLAKEADLVIEVVYGIPIILRGEKEYESLIS